jgi:hypothetical protein
VAGGTSPPNVPKEYFRLYRAHSSCRFRSLLSSPLASFFLSCGGTLLGFRAASWTMPPAVFGVFSRRYAARAEIVRLCKQQTTEHVSWEQEVAVHILSFVADAHDLCSVAMVRVSLLSSHRRRRGRSVLPSACAQMGDSVQCACHNARRARRWLR